MRAMLAIARNTFREAIRDRVLEDVVLGRKGSCLAITEPVTVSVGVAVAGPDGIPVSRLVERADGALYRAKRGGRNRVSL